MQWLTFIKKKPKYDLAVSIGDDHISMIGLDKGRIFFTRTQSVTEDKPASLEYFLQEVTRAHQLTPSRVFLVLDYTQYQLLMTDSLEMSADDLPNALKWKVKDLLEYEVDDALVDAFVVPPHGNAKRLKKAFVTVTSLKRIKTFQEIFSSYGFYLSLVTVSLLAERDYLLLLPDNKGTDILVSFCAEYCYISLINAGDVYFVRKIINQGGDSLLSVTEDGQCELTLELQRSMDYCQSSLKLPDVKRVFISPTLPVPKNILASIQNTLNVSVEGIDLSSYFSAIDASDGQDFVNYWYALGAISSKLKMMERDFDAAS